MRTVWGLIGVSILILVWLGPLPALSQHSFAAHMVIHMAVVAIAAPLLALGLSGTWFDPVRRAPLWFAPIPASLVELVVVWFWHAPALHQAARHSVVLFSVEQVTFLMAGMFFWQAIFGSDPPTRASRNTSGVVAVLLTFAHMTLLGALLALTPRVLYRHDGAVSLFQALADQQLGGVIMLVVSAVTYIAGGLWLTYGLVRPGGMRVGLP